MRPEEPAKSSSAAKDLAGVESLAQRVDERKGEAPDVRRAVATVFKTIAKANELLVKEGAASQADVDRNNERATLIAGQVGDTDRLGEDEVGRPRLPVGGVTSTGYPPPPPRKPGEPGAVLHQANTVLVDGYRKLEVTQARSSRVHGRLARLEASIGRLNPVYLEQMSRIDQLLTQANEDLSVGDVDEAKAAIGQASLLLEQLEAQVGT